MFRTILVPLDGSVLAERALPYAEKLAALSGARLLLLRAVPMRLFTTLDPVQDQARAAREAGEYLGKTAARMAERGQVVIVETLLFSGEAAQAIITASQVRQPDLIVMVSHRRGGIGRWVRTSVAELALAHGSVPLLLVAPGGGEEAVSLTSELRVIVPLDGSHFSEAALSLAEPVARLLRCRLVLLRVVPEARRARGRKSTRLSRSRGSGQAAAPIDPAAGARAYLGSLAEQLESGGVDVEVEVRSGEPASAILDAAADHDAGLVVMTTQGLAGFERALLGSVADRVFRLAQMTVLLVRPVAWVESAASRHTSNGRIATHGTPARQ